MIVVYPVRNPPDPTRHEDLRYSLRSLSNIPHSEVVIVGHAPAWVDRDRVRVIEVEQSDDIELKWHNIGANLKAAVEVLDGRFLWMNQDVFFMRRLTSIHPTARRLSIQRFSDALRFSSDPEHNGFVRGVRLQTVIARRWGVEVMTEPCLDSHHPLPMKAELAREMIERVEREYPAHPVGHFKNLYMAYIDEPIHQAPDPKVMGQSIPPRGGTVVSTSKRTWRSRAGHIIRARFRAPSPYELAKSLVK